MDLQDIKTVIVTGSGSGMGQACAERFLAEGWSVIGVDARPQEAVPGFHPLTCDITDEAALSAALDGIEAAGAVSALVNAAGIFPTSNLEDFTPELYRRIFDVNVLGSHNVARQARQRMAQGGTMLMFASIDAYAVSRNQLLYSASKAAVLSLVRSLAVELAPLGITVNAVAPGWVETAGTLAGGRIAEAVKQVPLGRAAQPAEIADWAWKFCAAPGYVTGETLCISGGIVVR
ncbi:SDR family oxidoreductase [Pseudooceanicola sp. CBS1P-1]|uniref:SDR family oxidoreductase n=1 Tax=Pseudooceanicola albus TaxID=2692189 RepID=A0A6L7G0J4_9RHOB|nr:MULTISPECIES: SDR family oxidoreductase [Pseudooceanicola]MBT9383604.1 SDR family oxidoreductase [Pseudooceanicola endophyticus]MXN17459.1 SDR family oxidoreductase [Pseudooceanicola albus]